MFDSQRLSQLHSLIQAAQLDAAVILPGYNLQALTGVRFMLLERPFMTIIPANGEAQTIIPSLEAQQFVETGFPGQVHRWTDADGYESAFAAAFGNLDLDGKTIGVEGLRMRYRDVLLLQKHTTAQIVDTDPVLDQLRLHKSAQEIEYHRKAAQISEAALSTLLSELKVGMTERQIARRLDELQTQLGGEGVSFPSTVLVGARSALPHGESSDYALQHSDILLIDYGTRYKGYVSDITRVFFVGQPVPQLEAVYNAVLAANEAGRLAARTGISGAALNDIVANVLREHGYGEYIVHRTGHGIGLDVHEHPNISTENNHPLAAGMVFTIEPGLYLPGVGGVRIEDNVAIGPDGGVDVLTTFPRDLQVLDLS